MQWRRRHCCTHVANFLYLLSLLGLLVFLVHLPKLTGMQWWKGHPVVFGGGELHTTKAKWNMSAPHSAWRFVIVPQPTFKTNANMSSPEKDAVYSPQGDPSVHNTLAANTSQSVEEDLSATITQGPFTYIINEPDKCADSRPAPFLVLLIATEARQVEARNAIRQTWGNESVAPDVGFIRLFLLGKNDGELGLLQQKMLEAESRSDMFVNTENLVYKLLRPEQQLRKNYFTGNNMRNFAPNRNKDSKWYMPPELYPGDKYPTFCSGTGYVFSGDLAMKIYRASLRIRHLQLEDVYVGVCLAKLRIEPTPPPNEFLFNHWRVSYSSCKYSHLITSHGFHPNELLKYWHHLQINKHNACINISRAGRTRSNRLNRERPAQ
ncbi:hypothetical protein NQZ68_036374 [Dissostichus eleginoides]|nr:hypothetical protein NQZ68_036374 [Dissostichus eleginoides]